MSSTPSFTTESASSFLSGIGVNTHLRYTDGGYANVSKVVSDLAYLGITQVRDQISNGSGGSAPISSYVALARAGVQFTFNVNATSTTGLQSQLGMVDQVAKSVAGSVVGIEGANEINNFGATYNGVSGLQGALNLQRALYSAVHSDSNLQGVGVDYFTGYNAGSIGMGPDPLATTGLADYDTQHPYPNNGQAPGAWVARSQALPNTASSTAAAVFTETGYTTNQVNQDVQAKYTLDLLLDTAKEGISKTYLYELMDAYAPGSRQGDAGFGLFDSTGAPKEAATAIHNLSAILSDKGANAAGFQATALNYSVAGLSSNGSSMAIEKSNGDYVIAVWAEPQIWNNSSKSEVAAPNQTVTITLPQAYATEQVFDPLPGSAPIATFSGQSSITVTVTDHPLLIEVSGAIVNSSAGSGSGASTSGSSTSGGSSTPSSTSGDTGGSAPSTTTGSNPPATSVVGDPSFSASASITTFASHVAALPVEPSNWKIQGTMDFNGDGVTDLVWRSSATGQFTIWDGTSTGFTQNAYVGSAPTNWTMAGFGDFNGDGKSDILWRSNTTGEVTIWSSTGKGFTQNTYINSTVTTGWHVQAVADFNGDGKSDILWRTSTGSVVEWQSTGSGFNQNAYSSSSMDSSWHVAAVADFNGDGKADILWQNASGALTEWQSTGTGFSQNAYTGSVGTGWTLLGAADLNGDQKADLVFTNASGAYDVWESNGAGFIQHVALPASVEAAFAQTLHHYDIV